MATHLHLSRLQSPSHANNASQIRPASLQPRTPLAIPLSKRAAAVSKLHAQGRGFGLTTVSGNKQKPAGNSNNNSSDGEGDDEEDAIPEVVFNRMLARIVSFVGAPMASGIGLLYLESSLKEQGVWESPAWVPFLTILLCFGTSAFGIAYGTLSTSWNPDKAGSLLGWEEAQKNWPELWKEEDEK